MADLVVVQNDVGTTVEMQLTEWDAATNEMVPIPFDDVDTFLFTMKQAGVALAGGEAQVVDAETSTIGYTWDPDDLSVLGEFRAQVKLLRGTTVETVPNSKKFRTVEVVEDMGAA